MPAYVLLEDGTRFDGEAVGAPGPVTGEVVFTTGMSGYQESMTDPSFARQLITFTVPHVGNYGVSEAAMESDRIHARGAIMRVFLITGASIGILGTLAGFALGLLIAANIQGIQNFLSWAMNKQLWDPTMRFLSDIPAEINPGEVTTVLVTAMILSLLATLYPSWRAARLDPVEALRYG